MSKSKKTTDLAEFYLDLLESGRDCYREADAVFAQLLERMKPGDKVTIHGTVYELVDNFAEKTKVFRSCGVSRFELKEAA